LHGASERGLASDTIGTFEALCRPIRKASTQPQVALSPRFASEAARGSSRFVADHQQASFQNCRNQR
jgi:hypothetical protein